MTHKALCSLAVKWLRYPNSRGGHGCQIAVSEISSGFTGERPDAIGFRTGSGKDEGSVVVEVKTSRSDFLADFKKPHRSDTGLGTWRYYLAPEGVIGADELPDRWGLIHTYGKSRLKLVRGPFQTTNYFEREQLLSDMRHDSDFNRERFILARLLGRVGDVEAANSKFKAVYRERDELAKKLAAMRKEIRRLRTGPP